MPEGQSVEHISEQPSALDAEWYPRFQEAGGAMAAYDYLEGTAAHRNAQRQQFESHEIENPTLDYPKLEMADLDKRDEAFLQLKGDIVGADVGGDEKMETVKKVYRWRLNEKLAEVRMLKAAAGGDMRRFQRYSQFLYGRPSEDVFSYTVNSLRNRLQPHLQSENVALQEAARDLDNALPRDLPELQVSQLPDEKTFQTARERTLAELGVLVSVPEADGELGAEAIKQSFDTAIETARLEGWKTVIDPNRANVSVSQEKKTAYVPESKTMRASNLAGLVLHEIGTHAVRRKNGERTKLMLLGLGLDRYRDDEGVTGLREQVTKDKVEDFTGLEGHLAASLAAGLDGTQRDFRGVYEVLQKHFLVKELAAGRDKETAEKNAAKQAWDRCVRTFRGTDCETPGVSFNKDILYREGNIDVWEVVRINPDEMMRFNVGKYDPANPRHIMILDQLGITDKDLEKLEK